VLALKAVYRTARYLALGLSNLVTIFIPRMIALTGGLMSSAHLFLPEIRKTVHERCGYVPSEAVIIQPVDQDTFAGLRGAAQVWLKSLN
jgi:glucokinase